MLPSLLALILASVFHPTAAASTLTPRQNGLNAVSVSTADFKSRFEQSGIVPEVIPALNPAVSFYAGYKSAGERDALLVPGSSLTISEAAFPFEFLVEGLSNATNITSNTRYLIYLLDADAPNRSSPTSRNLRHYLAGNYTASSTTSALLPTAQRLVLPSAYANPFTEFLPPRPRPDTGIHRFVYALYVQPPRFNTAGFESVGMDAGTVNWNLAAWRRQLGLGPAIGATFFSIDTGLNGGTGTSGKIDAFAGSSSDAVSSVASYTLVLTGALLALL